MDPTSKLSISRVYNQIAKEFDVSRVRIWPCVNNFLNSFEPKSYILDIGCGNGKNMLAHNKLQFVGIDISSELVKICHNKGLNVIECDMTSLPFADNTFDGFICIASYHHLSNDTDRKKALNEMYRILKPNGLGLIVVWAMEQPSDSVFHFTKSDEMVKWKSNTTGKIYERYYHIYSNNDLINEITKLEPMLDIKKIILEKGNWCVVVKKNLKYDS